MRAKKKKPKTKEPERLVRGKEFEGKIKQGWPPLDKPKFQKSITKANRRKGRIDIFIDAGDENNSRLVAVIEIKASDWDSMTIPAVRKNVKRQARQIWDYIDSQIEEGKQISPGVVFEKIPKDPRRLKLVEMLFEEQCIAVSWEDESIEQRKARS